MKSWFLAPLAVAWLVQPAWAASRDFSAPPESAEAPLPRTAPVSFSFGLGADYLDARWREPNPSLGTTESAYGGPATQIRVGVPIGEHVGLFIQGDFAVLLIGGHGPWLGMGGVGLGGTVFLPESRWHLDLAIRKEWAGTIGDVGIQRDIPLATAINEIWFGEIDLGYATRRGRVDRGISASLFGGLMYPEGTSGWAIGAGLIYAWSRS